ncbi:hypothetical protein ACFX15_039281 [Malus domestica]
MAMNLSSFFEGPVLRWKLRSETHQPTTAAEQRFCFYYKSFLRPIFFTFPFLSLNIAGTMLPSTRAL